MNLINKEFAKRSLIYSSNILTLPDFINKFKKYELLEVCHWSKNNVSLILPSSDDNLKNILREMKVNYHFGFRMFKENKSLRNVHPSKIIEAMEFIKESVKFVVINKSISVLFEQLQKSVSISEQIKQFYDFYLLSEYDLRLRHCYTANIERCIQLILPQAQIELFGSTASGLGKFNSDLDLKIVIKDYISIHHIQMLKKVCRHLRLYNKYMVNYDVFNCRFPICHYYDSILGITVDLSIINDTSVETAHILKTLSKKSPYFGPLCIAIKYIYIQVGILSEGPNMFFTGFKIVSLIIYFLQSVRLLPPLNLVDLQFDYATPNVEISTLLMDFFEYWIDFDTYLNEIDIGDGLLYPKKSNNFVQCVSHLNREHNILTHINQQKWNEFRSINRTILHTLKNETFSSSHLWGLGKFLTFENSKINATLP